MSQEPSPVVPVLNMAHMNSRSREASQSQTNGVNGIPRKHSVSRNSVPAGSTENAAARTPVNGSVARASTADPPSQPSPPRPAPGSAKVTSPSRPTTTTVGSRVSGPSAASGANGNSAAAIKASVVAAAMPEGQFSNYSGDVAKYLKEVLRRRAEAVYLRVLPKAHQLHQLVLQEATARELAVQQEQTARQLVVHKAHEERAKRKEQTIAKSTKERFEALKKAQQEEVVTQKSLVTALQAETETEIRARLQVIQALHPKLNPINAALADAKSECSDCAVLAALLEEEKKLQKSLKANARYAKSKTAETDGGALSHWLKDCVASSYNVAAILANSPYRASVVDAPSETSKAAADKKIVVVRATAALEAPIVAWAYTRVAVPDAAAAIATLLPLLGVSNAEDGANGRVPLKLPPLVESDNAQPQFAQVLWPKEDAAAVTKLSKSPKSEYGFLQDHTRSSLTYGGISSCEFTAKEVVAIGETASF